MTREVLRRPEVGAAAGSGKGGGGGGDGEESNMAASRRVTLANSWRGDGNIVINFNRRRDPTTLLTVTLHTS